MDLRSLIPWVAATGLALRELDEDKTGADDFAADLLIFAGEMVEAGLDKTPLPEIPEALRKGTTDKITGSFRATLQVIRDVLIIAKYQVTGQARAGVNFVIIALTELITKQPVAALAQEKPKAGPKKG